jgi:putative tryptophan/tyrosine transport system substrate-binding protein
MRDFSRRGVIGLVGSAAVPWPARAQQPAMPVIGFLHQGFSEPSSLRNAFRKGLSELGFIDGQNVTIEDRAAAKR